MRLTYKYNNTAVSIIDFEGGRYGAKIYQNTKNYREDEIHLQCVQIGYAFEGDSVLDAVNWFHDSIGLDPVDQHFVDLLFEVQDLQNWRSVYLLVDERESSKGSWGISCFGKGQVSKDISQLYRIDNGQADSGLYILAISPDGLELHKDFLARRDGSVPRVWESNLPNMSACFF